MRERMDDNEEHRDERTFWTRRPLPSSESPVWHSSASGWPAKQREKATTVWEGRHRLVGEGRHQLDLLRSRRLRRVSPDKDHPYDLSLVRSGRYMGAELYEAYVTFIVTRVVLNLAVIMASWLVVWLAIAVTRWVIRERA